MFNQIIYFGFSVGMDIIHSKNKRKVLKVWYKRRTEQHMRQMELDYLHIKESTIIAIHLSHTYDSYLLLFLLIHINLVFLTQFYPTFLECIHQLPKQMYLL